jgi:hypothetical protein
VNEVHPVHKVKLDHREFKGRKEILVQLDHRDQLGLQEKEDHREFKGRREILVQLGLWVTRGRKAHRGQ